VVFVFYHSVTEDAATADNLSRSTPFAPVNDGNPMRLYACVDSAEWCDKLVKLGTVTDIQIRVKVS